MNLNVFIDQVVVNTGGQPPAENASRCIEGAVESTAGAAPPAGAVSQFLAAGEQSSPQQEQKSPPQGEPPYWDSTGPREPPLEEGSHEWRLARRPAQVCCHRRSCELAVHWILHRALFLHAHICTPWLSSLLVLPC